MYSGPPFGRNGPADTYRTSQRASRIDRPICRPQQRFLIASRLSVNAQVFVAVAARE